MMAVSAAHSVLGTPPMRTNTLPVSIVSVVSSAVLFTVTASRVVAPWSSVMLVSVRMVMLSVPTRRSSR